MFAQKLVEEHCLYMKLTADLLKMPPLQELSRIEITICIISAFLLDHVLATSIVVNCTPKKVSL